MLTTTKIRWSAVAQIAFATAITVAAVIWIYRVESFARETRRNICTFVQDLDRRIQITEKALESQPGPTIRFGRLTFDRADVESDLANRKLTFQALAGLHCARFELPPQP